MSKTRLKPMDKDTAINYLLLLFIGWAAIAFVAIIFLTNGWWVLITWPPLFLIGWQIGNLFGRLIQIHQEKKNQAKWKTIGYIKDDGINGY